GGKPAAKTETEISNSNPVNKLNLSFFIMRFFLISSLISNNKRSILFVELFHKHVANSTCLSPNYTSLAAHTILSQLA
ncbi:hypothetical protein, partial [Bacteroides fragilis]|uniref:hypothetical protein n=1 Tax=Bacteroides fragilis TaxID=817 RepID=UPI0019557F42